MQEQGRSSVGAKLEQKQRSRAKQGRKRAGNEESGRSRAGVWQEQGRSCSWVGAGQE